MKTFSLCLGAALTLSATTGTSLGQVYVQEDFESYTSTADMQVNWGTSGLGVFDTTLGNPGNSAYHPGGAVNTWIGSTFSLTPTATDWIVLTADIYDDGTSINERMSIGLRQAGGTSPLFEMGHYQNTTEHYHVRVLGFANNDNWVPLAPGLRANSGQPAGWNRWEATFRDTSVTVTLDLGADGVIDGTFTSMGAAPANAFGDLRFGGPSGVSSLGGGVYFDNISLVVVPEPSVMALGLLGLLGLAVVARRRSRR